MCHKFLQNQYSYFIFYRLWAGTTGYQNLVVGQDFSTAVDAHIHWWKVTLEREEIECSAAVHMTARDILKVFPNPRLKVELQHCKGLVVYFIIMLNVQNV